MCTYVCGRPCARRILEGNLTFPQKLRAGPAKFVPRTVITNVVLITRKCDHVTEGGVSTCKNRLPCKTATALMCVPGRRPTDEQ